MHQVYLCPSSDVPRPYFNPTTSLPQPYLTPTYHSHAYLSPTTGLIQPYLCNAYDSTDEYYVASGYRGPYTPTQTNTFCLVGIAKDIDQYERIPRGRGVTRSEKNILSVTGS